MAVQQPQSPFVNPNNRFGAPGVSQNVSQAPSNYVGMLGNTPPTDNTDPSKLPWNASGLSQALQQLRGLKSQLTAGQINSAAYLQAATPIVSAAHNIENVVSSQGSKSANTVNPIWQQLQDESFIKNQNGQFNAALPLSEQEYAQLPDSAKPTADQINKGLVPAGSLPGNVALNTQIGQQQQQQQTLQNQAQTQAQTNQQNTQQQLQQLYGNFMNQTKQNYDTGYQDIAKSLQNQQNQAVQNLTTGPQGESLREYYNNMGLLNSGAFNQGLANQFGQIQQNTQNNLLQAQLDEQNALQGAAQQGVNALGAFGTGAEQQLQDIGNQGYQTQSGLGIGGLQRQFSLEDFYNQLNAQTQLQNSQQNAYQNALNQQKQNPWTQLGMGAASGLFQGAGQGLGAFLGGL
jgi:hypothetical protein